MLQLLITCNIAYMTALVEILPLTVLCVYTIELLTTALLHNGWIVLSYVNKKIVGLLNLPLIFCIINDVTTSTTISIECVLTTFSISHQTTSWV